MPPAEVFEVQRRRHSDLRRMLSPEVIAVVGGGVWCASVLAQAEKMGFGGRVFHVHPTKDGAYPSVEALPEVPDAVFVGVNRHATIEVISRLRDMGAGGAVCFASGFSEADAETGEGAQLQMNLLEAAGEMPVLGPNCYGFLNGLDGTAVWPDQHGVLPIESGVAILAQSSNIAINLTMQRRSLPIAYVVTVGNQAQTGLAEIGAAVLDDPRVTALGLYIEGIGDIRAFEALADRARRLGKSIVVVKSGRSYQARAAAVSHTASLAGSDAGSRALFKRLGIAQVEDLDSFLEALKLVHLVGALKSSNISSMSCSGGEASLIADGCVGRSLSFPSLTEGQVQALRMALGSLVALANPLDYHTFIWGDDARMADVMTGMAEGDVGVVVIVVDFPRSDICDAQDWECVINAAILAKARSDVPIACLAVMPEGMPEDVAERLMHSGIVPLCGLRAGLDAIEAAAWLGGEFEPQTEILLAGSPQNQSAIEEAEAKKLLSHAGVDIPNGVIVVTPDEAEAASRELMGPFVLKTTGVTHKTESGGVALGLNTGSSIRAAAEGMGTGPYLVEEMVTGGVAELLVGVQRDPAHGMVLTLAAGGVLTELMQDTVSLLLPVTARDIGAALRQLRVFPLLNGYRSQDAANINAIEQAVLAVQSFVCRHEGLIEELEINPLICTQNRAIAVDALIVMGDQK